MNDTTPNAAAAPATITKPTTFRDLEGREWSIVLRPSTVSRILEKHRIDLWAAADISENGPLVKLADERILLPVLWEMVAPQAEAAGVSKADFDDAFAGEVFDAAFQAIEGALLVFFSGARRSLLQATFAELEGMADRQAAYAAELREAAKAKEREILEKAKARFVAAAVKQAEARVNAATSQAFTPST